MKNKKKQNNKEINLLTAYNKAFRFRFYPDYEKIIRFMTETTMQR